MKTSDTLLVCYDFAHGKDVGVLIVGRKKSNESVEIVNAFQGKDAEEIYHCLISKKEK